MFEWWSRRENNTRAPQRSKRSRRARETGTTVIKLVMRTVVFIVYPTSCRVSERAKWITKYPCSIIETKVLKYVSRIRKPIDKCFLKWLSVPNSFFFSYFYSCCKILFVNYINYKTNRRRYSLIRIPNTLRSVLHYISFFFYYVYTYLYIF